MPSNRSSRLVAFILAVTGLLMTSSMLRPVQAEMSLTSRNIYLGGASVRPKAPVEGDLLAVGGKVVVDQPVKGDATLAGGSIDVRAPVGDDVRAAGGDVSMESTVGGELYATAGSLTITKTARIADGASLFGGVVTVDGNIVGPLRVDAQKLVLNAEVTGDADLTATDIELGPNAKITGALRYTSPHEMKQAEGSVIGGALSRGEPTQRMGEHGGDNASREWHRHMEFSGPIWLAGAPAFIALLACAAVFLLVFPDFSAKAADTVKTSPWLALALGFAALLGIPTIAGLLFITLLGIPLGIAVLALFPALLLMGYVVGILFISRRAQEAMRMESPGSYGVSIGFFSLVLVLVMLTGTLPFVGALVMVLITIMGLGACVLAFSRRGVQASPPAGAQSNLA